MNKKVEGLKQCCLLVIIHPGSNAVVSANKKATLRQRNQHVKEIQYRGVFEWRKTSGYYQQSKVENSFYRVYVSI